MEDNAKPKRMLKGRLYSERRKGRPSVRQLDDVENGLKKMKVKGWIEKIRNRGQWRLVVEEEKLTLGCSAEC
jgi:sirohydrochlorin ferrochelatase